MKRQRTILLVILLFLVYVAYRMAKSSQIVVSEPMPDDTPSSGDMAIQNTIPGARVGGCVKPLFGNEVSYSGRDCAGTVINENRMLALGDQGCEVLLLQQRLNAMQNEIVALKQQNTNLNLMMDQYEKTLMIMTKRLLEARED